MKNVEEVYQRNKHNVEFIGATKKNFLNEFTDISDYSPLQIHNFPKTSGRYKIVELLTGMTPHLIFPEENQNDHKEILKKFLDDNGIEYKIVPMILKLQNFSKG